MKLPGGLIVTLLLFCASTQGEDSDAVKRQKKFLVGIHSTKTHISLTTVTATVSTTCALVAIGTPLCKRRKRRLSKPIFINDKDPMMKADTGLAPSEDEPNTDAAKPQEGHREPRLKLIFWSTVTSLFTITSTSVNTAATFSVSFFCSIGGASYPPICG